jgi:predicted esterase/catechol 2,3-dioxygenase-like lactoylglutathione lyase family enzyme
MFRDHDGLTLEIVSRAAADSRSGWSGAPGVAAGHALRGIHAVTLWIGSREASERLLVDTLGFTPAGGEEATRWYLPPDGGTGRVDVREVGDFPRGMDGAGTVHHVAWRVADDQAQLAMRQAVSAAGRRPTPVIDRTYFHSVYFREPGGVLFELATDGPGFLIDEPVAALGASLKLPPQYEAARAAIEAHLPPIHLPGTARPPAKVVAGSAPELGFTHRFIPAAATGAEARTTLLLLHGTGGNEDDLLPLGRILLPGAALLSPRGQVLEHGAPRFFRRIAEGVFDQEDLARRTADLAGFVRGATDAYGLDPPGIVAVGFSNGANIAGSLLLRSPGLIRSAVLLSPMVPFEPEAPPDLSGTTVFIGAGRADTMVPAEQPERLRQLLEACGAAVTLHWDEGGHSISPSLVAAARAWLAERVVGQSVG